MKNIEYEITSSVNGEKFCVEMGEGCSGAGYFEFDNKKEADIFITGIIAALKHHGISFKEYFGSYDPNGATSYKPHFTVLHDKERNHWLFKLN